MNVRNAYRLLALLILAAIGIQRAVAMHRPASMVRYHGKIRAAADVVPQHIGAWVGQDVPVAVQAATLLRPNVMISRRYVNIENGLTAGFLFVHCSDAHAMAGHFPLRCYPARGWDVRSAIARDWIVDGLAITGMEYTFSLANERLGAGDSRLVVVANCLLRPGGKVLRDMDAMVASVIGAGGQASGAGQLQIYFDAAVPQEERDAAIVTLVGGYAATIRTILSGS
jgi:hypothetical protein